MYRGFFGGGGGGNGYFLTFLTFLTETNVTCLPNFSNNKVEKGIGLISPENSI